MKNTNTRILTIAVVLLLITNIALVAFFVMGKNKKSSNHQGGRPDPTEMMAKELNMTEDQKELHKQLREEHQKNIKPLFDSVKAAKIAYYSLVKDSTVSDSMVTAYGQRISERQSAIDKLTFDHFKKMRKLFTADQIPKYDEFLQKMMQRNRKDSGSKKGK